ncbi:cobaltochelatase subunit CobN [Methylocystis heyeri]|uniref:Cobaltochelatase subunit CobN n=1 Tax=Methylocystis heyeri TaxID=391905 RepID=A0A6B8KC85_9HYPH|nr:cobaltochelatase subunit CobN [Methylocystis heyeri]QGM45277.1 cobaltochelatase subunit CobN [Methylocystis heyeri]
MHLLARDLHGLDDADSAVDLEQTPADVVFLSFSDSELRQIARLHEQAFTDGFTLRCAPLALLKHPYSVDLYVEKVARRARLVAVRLLGGKDYWPYGVEQLAAAARAHGFLLAIAPGDNLADARLAEASTVSAEDCARIWAYFQDGGSENLKNFLAFASSLIGRHSIWLEPAPLPNAGYCLAARRDAPAGAARALIALYRSVYLADDIAPIVSLADALASRGFGVEAVFVASLKDQASASFLKEAIEAFRPDVVVNTTAFSARGALGSPLDLADAPVMQAALATSTREAWAASKRGANGADLAMNIVLPEVDGRIFAGAISFKAKAETRAQSEFVEMGHRPEPSQIQHVADLASNWAALRRKGNAEKSLGLILSDYPARRGRGGYAIGLDAPASVAAIAQALRGAGYGLGPLPQELMPALENGVHEGRLALGDYRSFFEELPKDFAAGVIGAWGEPEDDPSFRDGAFHFSCIEAGRLVVALQPDRGARAERRETYHDAEAAPRHSYLAFYLWLRHIRKIDALIHLGTHGTLEWLPGKSTMLSADCAPQAVLGPTPLIYPFIVNDPGEAAQAKRRSAAVTIGHLTPPLERAELYDDAARIENMLDEYSNAASLDPRRAKLIAGAILDEAERCGLAGESGVSKGSDAAEALARLDAWLCDIKEMRIGDGLHIFGAAGSGSDSLRKACATAEISALLRALEGRFVEPGPAGAPARGRKDVLPTGRNLFCIDPRHAPTRTAYDIGRRAAAEVMTRHAQEHGEWPRSIMLDLWGSATIRTGGEDFAQALALLGVMPLWDSATARVSGFEIEPLSKRDFPRVDVTLHISGLFRDMFPGLIGLFHDAVNAVAALDEDEESNPLARHEGAAVERIFGVAQGAYGLGLNEAISRGEWAAREELGQAFLSAGGNAYDRLGEARPAREQFAARVAGADALVHVQDMAEVDVLSGPAFAEFEGGFAAANSALGGKAAITHLDATRPERTVARPLDREIARALRARAANPRWIEGQMRHGHRGAAEIAETIDNIFAFSALGDFVSDAQFDLVFDATLGVEAVRDFLQRENPRAYEAIVRVFEEALRRGLWRSRRNSVHLLMERTDAQRA